MWCDNYILSCIYVAMLTSDFIESVKRLAEPNSYEPELQILNQVPPQHRQRYLQTLQRCNDIVMAYKLLRKGYKLPEINYERFIGYMTGNMVV